MDEDQQHNQAFGYYTDISEEVQAFIKDIKDNNSDVNELVIRSDDADDFTDQAWRLLGRYIANNTHLNILDLDESRLTDEKIILLFNELTSSKSLERLDLDCNSFGIEGLRSIVPLLQNSPNLSRLWLGDNRRIDSECFEILVRALHGRPIEKLSCIRCNIADITALDRYNLPNLQILNLNGNKIGKEGCITISNLLQKEGSTLTTLYLRDTNMGNNEAEIIAASLKNNTNLKELHLTNSDITERGYKAFSKLLVDVSSIESTYNSNHTLSELNLGIYDIGIQYACKENKLSNNPEVVGRAKVIKCQLNSQNRKEISGLQGIEYSSIGNIFADIEVNLLPRILALIGRELGHSEFYTSLLPVAPDLLSFINREAILEEERAKNTLQVADITSQIAALTQQAAALTNKNDQIDKRLTLIKLGDAKQTAVVDDGKECGGGEKRQRVN